MAETPINFIVESPQVDAPISLNFGGLFTDLKKSIDDIVNDIKSGSDEAITGLFLAGMFVFAGIFLWRKV